MKHKPQKQFNKTRKENPDIRYEIEPERAKWNTLCWDFLLEVVLLIYLFKEEVQ